MPPTSMFDDVANDLALWIDQTATEIAVAMAPRQAPFAATLTEQQKIEVYTRLLFNPDGSPNAAGRAKELARLGPEGFATVYKAVIKAHPELKPKPVDHDSIDALAPPPPPAAAPGPTAEMMGLPPMGGAPPGPIPGQNPNVPLPGAPPGLITPGAPPPPAPPPRMAAGPLTGGP